MSASPNDFAKVMEENIRLAAQVKKLQEEINRLKAASAKKKK